MRKGLLIVTAGCKYSPHPAWGSRHPIKPSAIPQIVLGRNEWSVIKFGLIGLTKSKLPITEEQRDWIDRSFLRLGGLVGAHRLFEAAPMLPTPEHFPDRYDRSEQRSSECFIGLQLECT